jgi:hypothetical protein
LEKLVGCAQACHEVIFERLSGTLGGVATMCVWPHELEVNVFVSHCLFECVGGFVVEILHERFEATVYKELVQFVVGCRWWWAGDVGHGCQFAGNDQCIQCWQWR